MQPARRGEGCLVSASLRASNDGERTAAFLRAGTSRGGERVLGGPDNAPDGGDERIAGRLSVLDETARGLQRQVRTRAVSSGECKGRTTRSLPRRKP
jgi:hypothetical protein